MFTALFTVECAFKLMSFGPKVSPKCLKFKILWMKDSCLNVNSKVKRNMNAQLKYVKISVKNHGLACQNFMAAALDIRPYLMSLYISVWSDT